VVLSLVAAGCSDPAPLAEVPYRNDFSAPALGKEWRARGGDWRIVDGRLFNDGAHNVPLWLSAALPRDVRVTFTAESLSPAVDLKFEIFGDGEHHQSGYVVILSGWNNTKSIIARLDEHGPVRTPQQTETLRKEVEASPERAVRSYADRRETVERLHRGQPNKHYRFRFERRGPLLQLYIDDQLHLEYYDPSPLAGPGHDRFAFNNWASKVLFDDLEIVGL